jgi:hypothetical protein
VAGGTAVNTALLTTGVLGLGTLTILSERWRLSHSLPLQMGSCIVSSDEPATLFATADAEHSG